jgi:hypothetical protein
VNVSWANILDFSKFAQLAPSVDYGGANRLPGVSHTKFLQHGLYEIDRWAARLYPTLWIAFDGRPIEFEGQIKSTLKHLSQRHTA